MRTSKSLYSECFPEFALTPEQLKGLQSALFGMLKDVKQVCEENGIPYMLSGGSVLGAVRHQGFIPWDDDIDLMMTRKAYEAFAQAIRRTFPEKYLLAEPLDSNYFYKMPKLFLRGSVYTELAAEGTPDYHMLFLDVFLIEFVPENPFRRRLRGLAYDFAYKASSVCLDYRYPSPHILAKGKSNRELNRYYGKRRLLGALFSLLGGMRFYLKLDEKLARKETEGEWVAIPAGISYLREIFPARVLTETQPAFFEGEIFPIPRDAHTYLCNLYGDDYMTPPPPEKRETHLAIALSLPGEGGGEQKTGRVNP